MFDEAVLLISNMGFPIFVAVWFMFRMEKVIKNNTKSLENIKQVMEGCPGRKD